MVSLLLSAAVSAVALMSAPLVSGQAPGQSVCERYAAQLFPPGTSGQNQSDLIGAIVSRAVLGSAVLNATTTPNIVGIVFVPELTPYFNGTVRYALNQDGSRDFVSSYLGDKAIFNTLATHLIQFFGAGFGCRASDFPAYQGNSNMSAVHAGMDINANIFNLFNGQLADTLTSFGVAPADITAAGTLLTSFGRNAGDNSICVASDCPVGTAPAPQSSSAVSSTGAAAPPATSASSTGGATPPATTVSSTGGGSPPTSGTVSSTGGAAAPGTSAAAAVVPTMAAAVAVGAALAQLLM